MGDQSRVEFTKWAPGEPNNRGDEDCAHFRAKDEFWNDNQCSDKMQSVCEVKYESGLYFYRNAIGRQNNFAQFTETNFTNLPTARAFFDWSKFDQRNIHMAASTTEIAEMFQRCHRPTKRGSSVGHGLVRLCAINCLPCDLERDGSMACAEVSV